MHCLIFGNWETHKICPLILRLNLDFFIIKGKWDPGGEGNQDLHSLVEGQGSGDADVRQGVGCYCQPGQEIPVHLLHQGAELVPHQQAELPGWGGPGSCRKAECVHYASCMRHSAVNSGKVWSINTFANYQEEEIIPE